jgi:PTH2 family peptidyl-tRNA hydrolase
MAERKVKQVIVMRTDLNMRKGKMIAQGSHASMAWLIRMAQQFDSMGKIKGISYYQEWIDTGMTKVCLRVDSEEELMEIYDHAKKSNMLPNLITDAGHTEFKGVPTKTCLAIGPNYEEYIDAITGHLKLL